MEKKKEVMELGHKPVPGYRKIFFTAFAAGLFYLGSILLYSIFKG